MMGAAGRGGWSACRVGWQRTIFAAGGRQRVFILPAKKQLTDSQEVVPDTWDRIRQKRQICKRASCEKKKSEKVADSQLADLEIWDTLMESDHPGDVINQH